jgi:hypothetical protein
MKRLLIATAFVVTTTTAMADSLMKPGLWEIKVVKQIMDGKDMQAQMAASQAQMQAMMASMPPAQRKQMEQRMGGSGMSNTGAQRICVSPEMAARDKPMMPPDSKCELAKYDHSGNKTPFEMKCMGMAGQGESISNGDTISTKMDMTMNDARGHHTMQTESQMKFAGSDCQGIKPVEQLTKELQPGRNK